MHTMLWETSGSLEADTQVVAGFSWLTSFSYITVERYSTIIHGAIFDNFSLDDFRKNHIFKNVAAFMVCRSLPQKSSANYLVPRVFSQKGNGVTIFGHTFYVRFSKIF